MHKGEYVLALGLLIAAVFIVPWSYQNWMTKTGQGSYSSTTSIVGSPSISAAQIDQILCKANSPACHTGYALYSYNTASGLNPAFSLAVFLHESNYGTQGIAKETKSLGNIRCTDGYSCIGGFRSYPSWEASYSDFAKLISGPLYVGSGLTTPSAILQKYAPAGDNNSPLAYAQDVESSMAVWKQGG